MSAATIQQGLVTPQERPLKRLLDLTVGVPAFALSVPFIALSALWIKTVSPGPAFFTHEREGKDGKPIRIYKLRTMYQDAEQVLERYLVEYPAERVSWLRYYKLKRDPRVISGIGRFLRHYSLDELPQLWNVLIGEMSLVGPRPFPEYHLSGFPPAFRALRASVMPGVTGLWQVSARSDGDLKVQEAADTYYIQNWSLWLDLCILLRTLRMLVTPNAAY